MVISKFRVVENILFIYFIVICCFKVFFKIFRRCFLWRLVGYCLFCFFIWYLINILIIILIFFVMILILVFFGVCLFLFGDWKVLYIGSNILFIVITCNGIYAFFTFCGGGIVKFDLDFFMCLVFFWVLIFFNFIFLILCLEIL